MNKLSKCIGLLRVLNLVNLDSTICICIQAPIQSWYLYFFDSSRKVGEGAVNGYLNSEQS